MTVLTLRPTGDNSYSQTLNPSTGYSHYACIDEATLDEGDYCSGNTSAGTEDAYNMQDHTNESGSISNVTVKCYFGSGGGSTGTAGNIGVLINGISYILGSAFSGIADALYTNSMNTNPNTSAAWTWSDIDALVGLMLIGSPDKNGTAGRCYQFWIEVTYSAAASSGTSTQIIMV